MLAQRSMREPGEQPTAEWALTSGGPVMYRAWTWTACGRLHPRHPRLVHTVHVLVADWRFGRHNGAMPSVQIKDVPEQTHAILRQRAAAAHQSLQEYLRARLIEEASEPTLDEILGRAGGRSGGSVPLEAAAAALRADRDRR
jgi:antitoxin FitA